MTNLATAGATLIKGAPLRDALRAEQAEFFGDLPQPAEVAFLIALGNCGLEAFDPATESFAKGQAKYGKRVNVAVDIERHGQGHLNETLRRLGSNAMVHGIIMGEPVPDPTSLDVHRRLIPTDKDIDGANPLSEFHLRRPTPSAMVYVAEAQGINLERVNVAVLGSNGAIGGSLMRMLQDMNVNTYGVDRHNSAELPDVVRSADVVFSAANRASLITPDMLTDPSKLVIDAAIIPHEDGSGIVGSVDPAAYEDSRVRSTITPVPGGVGVLNTAMVFNNLRGAIEQRIAA